MHMLGAYMRLTPECLAASDTLHAPCQHRLTAHILARMHASCCRVLAEDPAARSRLTSTLHLLLEPGSLTEQDQVKLAAIWIATTDMDDESWGCQ